MHEWHASEAGGRAQWTGAEAVVTVRAAATGGRLWCGCRGMHEGHASEAGSRAQWGHVRRQNGRCQWRRPRFQTDATSCKWRCPAMAWMQPGLRCSHVVMEFSSGPP